MITVTFDTQVFRQQFREFENASEYTNDMLTVWFGMATNIMTDQTSTYWTQTALSYALNLLVAHLAKSMSMIAAGQTTAVVTGATEGSVTVSMEPPPTKNAFQWWLSTTPYGAQLRALLSAQGAGGFAVGGSLERSAFRKANGIF